MTLSAKTEARAFRIWAFCQPRGWDVTAIEIAEATGLAERQVLRTIELKGWGGRIRQRRRTFTSKNTIVALATPNRISEDRLPILLAVPSLSHFNP
jgi:hypothetical protein